MSFHLERNNGMFKKNNREMIISYFPYLQDIYLSNIAKKNNPTTNLSVKRNQVKF